MESKHVAIGYTTGVFDLFHVGHLNILRQAKSMCDYLIVGVSTDECVWEYKKKRSIIPFAERIEIVQAIRFVDEVYPQNTMDKLKAWEALRFNALFHGDDWKGSDLYRKYEIEFAKIGVELVFIPYTKGISSTQLAAKLEEVNL